MSNIAASRFALPLGLLLVFCSTGLALECYQCSDWRSSPCTTKATCSAGQNSCLVVTKTDTGLSYYSCRNYGQCSIQAIKDEFLLTTSISVSCCQFDNCNGLAGLQASGLVVFMGSALLLLLFS